jgi:hypothetical protein
VLATKGLHRSGVILRHYAFADRRVKINVTTDGAGRRAETPPGGGFPALCFSRDIGTNAAPQRGHLAVDPFG